MVSEIVYAGAVGDLLVIFCEYEIAFAVFLLYRKYGRVWEVCVMKY